MATLDLRPRTSSELIDVSIQVLRRYYVQLTMVTMLAFVPAMLMRLLLPEEVGAVLAAFAARLGGLFASAGLAVVVSDAYLGRPVSATQALGNVGERFGSVFGASLLQGFAIVLGILLLLVPGVIFFAWSFAMEQAVMIEGYDAGGAWTRSRQLARGSVWRILGTLGLTYLIYSIAVGGGTAALGLLFGSVLHAPARITEVVSYLINALVYPVVGVVSTLLYYDLRIRKEGFDLEMLATELGGSTARRKINLTPDALA